MTNMIPLHVAATLAGLETVKVKSYKKYSKEIKRRITVLGLEALFENDKLDASKQLEILERCVWKLAANVKKRRFGYKKKDFINALNFLESFCLFAGQANLASGRNKKVLKNEVDTTVIKAVREIESINKSFESNMNKRGKTALKKHIGILNRLIDKILIRNLSQTEQIAMGKVVNKAERILDEI